MAWQRYRQGDYNNPNEYQSGISGDNTYRPSPYASFPHPGEDDHNVNDHTAAPTYQQQPFGAQPQPFGVPPPQPVKTEYNVPEY